MKCAWHVHQGRAGDHLSSDSTIFPGVTHADHTQRVPRRMRRAYARWACFERPVLSRQGLQAPHCCSHPQPSAFRAAGAPVHRLGAGTTEAATCVHVTAMGLPSRVRGLNTTQRPTIGTQNGPWRLIFYRRRRRRRLFQRFHAVSHELARRDLPPERHRLAPPARAYSSSTHARLETQQDPLPPSTSSNPHPAGLTRSHLASSVHSTARESIS